MNLEYFSLIALTWKQLGFGWCTFSFLLGLWIGWRIWRSPATEVKNLENEALLAQKEYEKCAQNFSANREIVEPLLDSNSK